MNETSFGAARGDDLGSARPHAVPARQQIGTDRPFGDTYRRTVMVHLSYAGPTGNRLDPPGTFWFGNGLAGWTPRRLVLAELAVSAGGLGGLNGLVGWVLYRLCSMVAKIADSDGVGGLGAVGELTSSLAAFSQIP